MGKRKSPCDCRHTERISPTGYIIIFCILYIESVQPLNFSCIPEFLSPIFICHRTEFSLRSLSLKIEHLINIDLSKKDSRTHGSQQPDKPLHKQECEFHIFQKLICIHIIVEVNKGGGWSTEKKDFDFWIIVGQFLGVRVSDVKF